MARTSRRSRPVLDGLEGRQLLTGHRASPALIGSASDPIITPRWIAYATLQGAQVQVGLLGSGVVQGSTVNPDGALNLVYSGTNAATKIFINVAGGTAPLRSIHNANLSINDLSGVGGQILGSILAPNVDLVASGNINLTPGIGRLVLRSIGPDTQLHLRDLPQTVQPSTTGGTTGTGGSGSSAGTNAVSGVSGGSISVTTGISVTGTGATAVVTPANSNVTLRPGEAPVSAGVPETPTAPSSFSESGRTLTYSNNANGGSTLTGVSGQVVDAGNLVVDPAPTPPAGDPAPPGVIVQVGQVNAGVPGFGTIFHGVIFGYDPTAGELIRFDARTGAQLPNPIAVGGTQTVNAGLGLGLIGTEEVVLLARGPIVQAWDASTGSPIGAFSAANLGLNHINGVAFTGPNTVLTDPSVPSPLPSGGAGASVAIDVSKSLATGAAQPVSAALFNDRDSFLLGDTTSVPGTDNVYSVIAGHFDAFDPANFQLGVATINAKTNIPNVPSTTTIPRLTATTAFSNTANPQGVEPYVPATAGVVSMSNLGSIEGFIARDTGLKSVKDATTGATSTVNAVNLYSTAGLASVGSISLADPNPLVALSESFHPELVNAALVDVQGNVQSFNAGSAHGLALNVAGNLNLVKIVKAADSTIVGYPVGHLILVSRQNVTVETPSRSVGTRQGVVVDPTLPPLGPLVLPS